MTSLHRLLVPTEDIVSGSPRLPREALRHLRALRPKEGERFELFDGTGRTRVFRHAGGALSPDGEVREAPPRGPATVTLFACVTKGSRWDWTVEKATELGADRIVPVISARTIVRLPAGDRAAKRDRWRRVAEDAARQSDAVWLPEISEAVDFADALPLVRASRCFVGALTEPPPPPILAAVSAARASGSASAGDWSVFVGPEGDFSPDELDALLAVASPVSLGPAVLRAETAALFALSVLVANVHAAQEAPQKGAP